MLDNSSTFMRHIHYMSMAQVVAMVIQASCLLEKRLALWNTVTDMLLEAGEGQLDTMSSLEFVISEIYMNENLPGRVELIEEILREDRIK